MKALCTLAALTLAAHLWSILPQDTDAMEQANKGARSLRRTGSGQDFDRDTWRARLREPDLDLREQHFVSLVRAAQRSRSAEEALRTWAREDDLESHEGLSSEARSSEARSSEAW